MAKPDGSHDKLPPEQAEAVNRTLRHYGLCDGLPVQSGSTSWSGRSAYHLLVGLALGALIMAGVIVFYGGRDDSPRPDVVVVTVTSVPSLTPYPSGWVPR